MDKIKSKYKEIIDFCKAQSDESVIKKYSRYFKEGFEAYGVETKIFEQQKQLWLTSWDREMSLGDYLDLGDKLTISGNFEEAGFATHFIASKRKDFTPETLNRIGNWLDKGIQNWANTDVLCMLVLSAFLFDEVVQPEYFLGWNKSTSKWKRRAVPVTFVETIKKGHSFRPVLKVIEQLMEDGEDDVQKGLGTLLREIWKKQPEVAEAFLLKWKNRCGRKIIQYATEKMDKTNKARFKRSKK